MENQTYSDGDVIENQILEFFKSGPTNEEILSFLDKNPSWPIKYHVSPDRHNLLSWYRFTPSSSLLEIGAGCGGITGLFLKRNLNVTAVELTKRRADILRYRFKDRKNLEIYDGNIENKNFKTKYDYVTSIGVLEYSGRYIDSETPFLDFIKTAKGFLKKKGFLIIAIENRLGLKYWRGAPEDHTNILFDSLEGYPNFIGIKTFGKRELTQLVVNAGFKKDNISFYYPLPDYKFCYEVFSEKYLPSEVHNISHGIYPSPHPSKNFHLFNEDLVSRGLQDNHLFGELANSFLVVIKNV